MADYVRAKDGSYGTCTRISPDVQDSQFAFGGCVDLFRCAVPRVVPITSRPLIAVGFQTLGGVDPRTVFHPNVFVG